MKENERPFASDVEKNSNDARNVQPQAPASLLPTILASLGLEGSGAQSSQAPASVTAALPSERRQVACWARPVIDWREPWLARDGYPYPTSIRHPAGPGQSFT